LKIPYLSVNIDMSVNISDLAVRISNLCVN
jgi:hypothetical protein